MELVDAACYAGADAVKFQCFTPEQMAAPGKRIEGGPWDGRELLDLYREIHTPREWFPDLFDLARRRGVVPFSSVFHVDDVDFLETLNCPIYKIASLEITDLGLIKYAAGKGKPLFISTGCATILQIRAAVAAIPWETEVTVLKCTSAYPAPIGSSNLNAIKSMKGEFPSVGFSDHTLGHTAAVVATALGATVIEKHLILDRSHGGPDAVFSAEPKEFAAMALAVRDAHMALGEYGFGPTLSEAPLVGLQRPPGGMRGGM